MKPDIETIKNRRADSTFKAQRLAKLAEKIWDEKGWTEEKMQAFLQTHMRTPYKAYQSGNEA